MAFLKASCSSTTRLFKMSENRMSSGSPIPRRITSSTSSLRLMVPASGPFGWQITCPWSPIEKYAWLQYLIPYVSAESATVHFRGMPFVLLMGRTLKKNAPSRQGNRRRGQGCEWARVIGFEGSVQLVWPALSHLDLRRV